MNKPKTPSPIVDEEDRVILRDELARDVIGGNLWGSTPHKREFNDLFELMEGKILGDPDEDWHQGVVFIRVIRRKRDGRRFGFTYWEDISKYGECSVESNADEYGVEVEYDENWSPIGGYAYVFLPVRPFTVTGYRVEKGTSTQ